MRQRQPNHFDGHFESINFGSLWPVALIAAGFAVQVVFGIGAIL